MRRLLYNRYQAARDNIHRTEPPFAYVISDRQADVPEAGLLAQKMIDNGLDVYQIEAGLQCQRHRLSGRFVGHSDGSAVLRDGEGVV